MKVPHSTRGARHAPSPHRPKAQVAPPPLSASLERGDPHRGPSSGTPRARTEHRGHRTGLSKHPHARRALTASLTRLGTDHVDLYQLHISDAGPERAAELRDVCEGFVREGLVRAYAWSTDDPARAAVFAEGEHCTAVQHAINMLQDAPDMIALCEESNLASVNRSPLAMGLLGGKRQAPSQAGDIRSRPPAWLQGFGDGSGADPEWLARVDALKDVLTSGGRTLAQGALAWLWARSPRTIPIPGFRSVAQAEQNAGALEKGPLTAEQMADVERILGR
ncbi:aldo/keto reductase [Streptomyces sp. NL15-2K]|uniref:aldo/keto reductase n=1 Tax=Streptomyces sp. NL15-2K TaxID=376149 RepID=UPI000FF98E19|nr:MULTISPECIES: aldo/keto reductase [Actinomycetes]WKX08546.1 aldo/keto reductase [Kutzneria buriramensis]GCB49971.1 hypothetical protein SNL152K_7314 [Streptomyces sp. NL15-2K]